MFRKIGLILSALIFIYGSYVTIRILSVGQLNEFGKGILAGGIVLLILGVILFVILLKRKK